jgi:hypothetical protein
VAILLNRERFETALPQATSALVLTVMTPYVRREQTVNPAREVTVPLRAHNQMQMVRHEAGCEYWQLDLLLRLRDQ